MVGVVADRIVASDAVGIDEIVFQEVGGGNGAGVQDTEGDVADDGDQRTPEIYDSVSAGVLFGVGAEEIAETLRCRCGCYTGPP